MNLPLGPHASPAPSMQAPGAPPWAGASPFTLTPARDDTALYQDARVTFSHLLPGRPSLGMATRRPGDPPADAVIHLQDAPITIRYHLELPSFAASSAGELARGTADRFASWRVQAPAATASANDSWLVAWGVEGAAVSTYDLPARDDVDQGVMHEDLFVLVRQGAVMLVSWTYPRGFADDPAFATFASVAEATMVWDAARWQQHGSVWPEGAFFGPGLHGAARPRYGSMSKQLATAPLAPEERAQVLAVVAGVVSHAGAPWVPLAPEVVEAHKQAMLAAARDASLRAFVNQAFTDVRTAHDLRGLAIVVGRALDSRSASSILPALPGSAGLLHATPPAGARLIQAAPRS